MHQIILCVGCALTHASKDFVQTVETLKKLLREEGFKVLEFLGTTVGTPGDVVRRDIKECIGACDLFVALADSPSTDLGLEIGAALWLHKRPVLVFIRADNGTVTRAVPGLPDVFGGIHIVRYANMHVEIPWAVREHCKKLRLAERVTAPALEQFADPATGQPLFRQKVVPEFPGE